MSEVFLKIVNMSISAGWLVLAVLLSDIMCAVAAYAYRGMLCGIEHLGYSAPAEAAFLYAVPFVAGIALCCGMARHFQRKSQ